MLVESIKDIRYYCENAFKKLFFNAFYNILLKETKLLTSIVIITSAQKHTKITEEE